MSLINEIRQAQEAEEFLGVGKTGKTKELFEKYRKDYPLLEQVIQGETTFEGTYQPLVSKYEGAKAFFIPRWINAEERDVARQNRELLDDYNLSSRMNSMFSTLAGGAVLGEAFFYALAAVAFGSMCLKDPANTSTYIERFGQLFTEPGPLIMGGIFAGLGSVMGLLGYSMTRGKRNQLREDLRFLDEQIQDIYRGK